MTISHAQSAQHSILGSEPIAANTSDLFDHLESHANAQLLQPSADGVDMLTNAALVAESVAWSTLFAASDIPVGTACVLPMRNELATVCALLGALHHGLFPILMKSAMPPSMVHDTLVRAGGGIAVVRPTTGGVLRGLGYSAAATERDGLQVLRLPVAAGDWLQHEAGVIGLLSSGSTGAPKVICHAMERMLLNAQRHVQAIGVYGDDTVAMSLPLGFSSGLVAGLFGTLLAGADGILVDPLRVNLNRVLAELPPSVCMGTPATVLSGFDAQVLSGLRRLTIGGDVLHPNLARRLVDAMPNGRVFATYGLTEAGPRVASRALDTCMLNRFGAVPLGQPLDGVSLYLQPDDGDPNLGELVVETPTAMLRYLGDEAGTQAVLDGCGLRLRTGDMFKRRDGELFFIGRKKRIIVRGGENIYPAAIENAILRVAAIDDAWVVAQSHAQLGEVPVAYLRAQQPVDLDTLTRELRRHLPRSHIPVHWQFVDELPKGARK